MPTLHTLTDEEQFCLEGCRDYAQYYVMRTGFENGSRACPFCTLDTNLNKVLYQDAYWMAWENPFPRDTLAVQLVIASVEHVRDLEKLSYEALGALSSVFQWIKGQYPSQTPGGNLHVRFGDMRYNAGTVPHLHFNYWVPSGTGEVRIPVFKDPADRKKNQIRTAEFGARYEGGETP